MNRYEYNYLKMNAKESYIAGLRTGVIDEDYTMLFVKKKNGYKYVAFLTEDKTDTMYYCNK